MHTYIHTYIVGPTHINETNAIAREPKRGDRQTDRQTDRKLQNIF